MHRYELDAFNGNGTSTADKGGDSNQVVGQKFAPLCPVEGSLSHFGTDYIIRDSDVPMLAC
jgi:hypothetical protein